MPARTLRADAERNRRRLLAAARDGFAEKGIEAPLDEIARRAGVGNATLYRHFPTRGDLVAAVFEDTLHGVLAAIEAALADPDPWSGFTGYLTFLCELQAGNRALGDLLVTGVHGTSETEALRGKAFDDLDRLIGRARAGGGLRADFRRQDVVLILMANAGLTERTCPTAPSAWRRHLGYVLAGLRAPADPQPLPGTEQVLDAVDALAGRSDRD